MIPVPNEILSTLRAAKRVLVASHIYPDGDALGSMIAFYYYLVQNDKKCAIVVPGRIPPKYEFLNTSGLVNRSTDSETKRFIADADVIVIFDISSMDRLEQWYEPVKSSQAYKVCMDHHPLYPEFTDLDIIDDTCVATGELVFQFLEKVKADISFEMAEALYTAILSDSGSFRFQQTSKETFRIASRLTELGVDPAQMYSRVFEKNHRHQLKAWGNLLINLKSEDEISWLVVSREFMREHNLRAEDLEGIIDIMRKDGGSSVFAVFTEKEENLTLVGLRSKNSINVGRIAREFGGGGHFHAAGFSSSGRLEQVVGETLDRIRSYMMRLGDVA